jgi:hypothetical protein
MSALFLNTRTVARSKRLLTLTCSPKMTVSFFSNPPTTVSSLLITITDLPGKGSAVWDSGTWSHFTFEGSGYTVINTIDRGAFVVRPKFGLGRGKYWRKH